MRLTILAASLLVAAQSAAAESGPLMVWFDGTASSTSDKLAILCADRGAAVVEQDDRHVLCQREISGGKGVLAQALLGNSRSTSPQLMIRFAILRDREYLRVQASQWIEVQMSGGQTRRTELNANKNRTDLENLLLRIGAHSNPPSALFGDPPRAPSGEPAKQ